MTVTTEHAENCQGCLRLIARHDPCQVELADWPYDCDAKRNHPRDFVYVCRDHGVWWHQKEPRA